MQKRNEIDMEEKREVQNNNIIEVFPDIIETTFDISDDVTVINDMVQDDLYTAWIKSIADDDTLSSTEKATEWERIAKSYRDDRENCESIICNERKERTENMVKIFQKVVLPTLIVFTVFGGIYSISKLPQFQKKQTLY